MIRDPVFDRLDALIEAKLGHYRQKGWHSALLAELQARGGAVDSAGLVALADELSAAPLSAPPWQAVINRIAVGETRFLRDSSWFGQVERQALLDLIQRRRAQGLRQLRCWSAGCSTGEEAYTLALLLHDLLSDVSDWSISILATDARSEALRVADAALYDRYQLRELTASQIRRHFLPATDRMLAVTPSLRRMIRLSLLNLADEAGVLAGVGGGFDLILCRNVLIYMGPEQQRFVGQQLAAAVADDGWLAVSPAEAVAEWYAPLCPVNTPEAILFQKRSHTVETVQLPQYASAIQSPSPIQPWASQPGQYHGEMQQLPLSSIGEDSNKDLARLRQIANGGALAEAVKECRRLLARSPLNDQLYLLFAEILLELGDWAAARDAARRAASITPDSALAHFLLAEAFRRGGMNEKARRAMHVAWRLADISPGDTPVLPESEITVQHIQQTASLFLGRELTSRRRRHG
ncbi:CheR family methyltransferase [Ferrovibrio sp.]|uniref:CheR family methyltransferase n=1 Tax=Ferrovibrio sp. TaxID=1917215 RepID=UPI003D14D86C